jgi:hypothetical protein
VVVLSGSEDTGHTVDWWIRANDSPEEAAAEHDAPASLPVLDDGQRPSGRWRRRDRPGTLLV